MGFHRLDEMIDMDFSSCTGGAYANLHESSRAKKLNYLDQFYSRFSSAVGLLRSQLDFPEFNALEMSGKFLLLCTANLITS